MSNKILIEMGQGVSRQTVNNIFSTIAKDNGTEYKPTTVSDQNKIINDLVKQIKG